MTETPPPAAPAGRKRRQVLPREAWGYAILLVLLCAIAALAVWQTIDFLGDHLERPSFHTAALLIWTITLGFMLIAGAFGLWATRFAASAESRRRISHIVDEMDYLPDGLLAVDTRGRVTGMNPTARSWTGGTVSPPCPLGAVFPCLGEDDIALLIADGDPAEVEREMRMGDQSRMVRFRSQPAQGLMLLLLSDVTRTNAERARCRQAAQLQLVGQIAKGVARDFDGLLCGIAGYAALIGRLHTGPATLDASLRAIHEAADKGVRMAAHLLHLVSSVPATPQSASPSAHVRSAADRLRDTLPAGWQVDARVSPVESVAIGGTYIEQMIQNLGFVAAEAFERPAVLSIAAGERADRPAFRVDPAFSAAIVVGATPEGGDPDTLCARAVWAPDPEAGIVVSVIDTLLHEAGGRLETTRTPEGHRFFRICLRPVRLTPHPETAREVFPEMRSYFSRQTVLLAAQPGAHSDLERCLREASLHVDRVPSIGPALARIESAVPPDAALIEAALLGETGGALLEALLKLRPTLALVVIGAEPDDPIAVRLADRIAFPPKDAGTDRVCLAMIEAKAFAASRARA